MAFQDFDHLSERRKFERQQKFRKRVTIAAITAFILIILIAAGVFGVVSQTSDRDSAKNSSSGGTKAPKDISRPQKLISTICNGTIYKNSCNSSLSAAAKKDPSIAEPKDFLKASIAATVDELDKAIKKANSYDYNTPETKAAFKVCTQVLDDAKRELNLSVSQVGGKKNSEIEKLIERSGELNNWLSAVLSYQQTCVDGFPEGDRKSDMTKNLNATKQLTSNSLAMISQISNYTSLKKKQGNNRRLLDSSYRVLIPPWISHQERKISEDEKNEKIEPNLTVAKDGSGKFTTISKALAAVPQDYKGRYVIYVKAGIYEETVTVPKGMVNLTIIGEGSQKSIISGNKNVGDGINIYDTATFVAIGDGLFVKSMGFRNIADPKKGKAVAARVQSDRAIFQNCRFEGYQNTLWAQTHRQFYRSCLITGTIDFIFGDPSAIFQNCKILVRKPLEGQKNNVITGQNRIDKFQTTGIVLQNCEIAADESLEPVKKNFRTYLGRPSKEYSRTIVMDSTLGDLIHPEGWLALKENYGLKTLYYAEFDNKGPGASTKGRVRWPGYKVIDKKEAMEYTVGPFLQGDKWIKQTGAAVQFGLF